MIIENLTNQLHLPKDILFGASIMHITGQYEIYIENYKSIIEYNDKIIKVLAKTTKIYITGTNLHIEYFNNDDMKISGRIKNIELIT